MTSLLTVRPAPHDAPPWSVDVIPYAYDEAARVQIKGVPGMRWVPDRAAPNGRGLYRGPVEAARILCAVLESAGVVKVQWDAALDRRMTGQAKNPGVDWDLEQSCHYAEGLRLRDYQETGRSWCAYMMRYEGAGLLADEMGIGKSAQAVTALACLDLEAVTVVCPAVVKSHWAKQFDLWLPPGAREDGMSHALYSYEGFAKAVKAGAVPRSQAIVFDEIHYLANPKAQRTKAALQWCASNRDAKRLGLSGTPMTTRPRDLWCPLDILWPGRFGSSWEFQRRYCAGQYVEVKGVTTPSGEPLQVWNADGASRSEELATRLGAVMLRRTKADVALELPPRQRIVHEIEIPSRARKDLQRAAAAINWTGQASASINSLLSNVEQYKIAAACDLARDVVQGGGKVLILTTRKASAAALGRELLAPVVDGDTDPTLRAATLQGAEIGVATIYAVTTGIDLTTYDTIIFTGLDWVPSTLLQAEARIHRLGQRKACTVYYLIAAGTLDEVVRERVIERLDMIARTLGGSGDEGQMGGDLGGGSEEDLIAQIVADVRKAQA